MAEQKIKVTAYSGYRGEETPRKFVLPDDKEVEVVEILSRWTDGGRQNKSIRRFFKTKGSDGSVHKIYYDETEMEWFLTDVSYGSF